MRKEVRGEAINHKEASRVSQAKKHHNKSNRRQEAKDVQILPVRLVRRGLVLGDTVNQGVPGFSMRDKKTTDT